MTTSSITAPANNTPASTNTVTSNKFALKPEDFIQMMVTQLQNQDPMQPTDNAALLAQMSQIGQLQASTDLETSLKSMVLQNNIASSSSMIGKHVQGLDDNGDPVDGLVNSVKVVKDKGVYLELDNGKTLPVDFVTSVAPDTTATGAATTTPTPAAASTPM